MAEAKPSIRIGDAYQAVITSLVSGFTEYADAHTTISAECMWTPNKGISEQELESYVQKAKNVHHYSLEQSLSMLFWHKHDVDKALADLKGFEPFTATPYIWTDQEKLAFLQGYQLYGAELSLIQLHKLPQKGIAQVVQFYYNWKASMNEPEEGAGKSFLKPRKQ